MTDSSSSSETPIDALRPCPFCAGGDILVAPVLEGTRVIGYEVRCACHARIDSIGFFPSDTLLRRTAIDKWNQRATAQERLQRAQLRQYGRDQATQIVEARHNAQAEDRTDDLTATRAWRELLVRRVVHAIRTRGDILPALATATGASIESVLTFGRTLRGTTAFLLGLERWLDAKRIPHEPKASTSETNQAAVDTFLDIRETRVVPVYDFQTPRRRRPIQRCAAQHIPSDLPPGIPPETLIRCILDFHGWTFDAWCRENAYPPDYINDQAAHMTLDAAWWFTRLFGYTPEFWLRLAGEADRNVVSNWRHATGL